MNFRHSLSRAVLILLVLLLGAYAAQSQFHARNEIGIPDIPGYHVLRFDFHMHTVFSDGKVWPTIRAAEAWREGLDGIAITDHLEYFPYKDDIPANFNRSYEIARPSAESLGLFFFRGAEITRPMPPGHLNAIFLEDVDKLATEKWEDAVQAALAQKAFIFWNHPGWRGQQPDGIARWYEEHTMLLEQGWLHGIEVVNGDEYYPEAHRWCLEKNLTMMGNSDIHDPMAMRYDFSRGEHRPLTLVLAKERTEAAIREALFDRRTVVYWKNVLIGSPRFLSPMFEQSISVKNAEIELAPRGRAQLQIHNASQMDYELELREKVEGFDVPQSLTLYANRTVLFAVRSLSNEVSGEKGVSIPYTVNNLKVTPEEGLPVSLTFHLRFVGPD